VTDASNKKIAIVGGGVAGCYCAYRLANEHPEYQLTLFEISDRLGGRLYSIVGDETAHDAPIELGGMTYSSTQKNVVGLVAHLGLLSEEVEFDRESQFLRGSFLNLSDYIHPSLVPFKLDSQEQRLNPYELLRKALLEIYPGYLKNWPLGKNGLDKNETYRHLQSLPHDRPPLNGHPLYQWGFWNLLSQTLSTEAYNVVRRAIGLSTMFRNVNAFDAIWNILEDNHLARSKSHYRLSKGYQSLPENLIAQCQGAVELHFGQALKGLSMEENGSMSLTFESHGEHNKVIDGFDEIILALPRQAIDNVVFDNTGSFQENWDKLSRSIKRVFGSRMYLVFEDAWWAKSKFGPGAMKPNKIHYTTTDLPLRNCTYLGRSEDAKNALLIASFADGVAASFWSSLVHPDNREPPTIFQNSIAPPDLVASDRMVMTALEQLQLMHSDRSIPQPIDAVFIDWSKQPSGTGWHSWEPYAQSWLDIPASRRPVMGLPIHICGETFVHHNGWVESAINSAETMLCTYFDLDRAVWIPEEYELEPKGANKNGQQT